MTYLTCRLTAKYRDQLRNPTLGNRVWATFYVTAVSGDLQRPASAKPVRAKADQKSKMVILSECVNKTENCKKSLCSTVIANCIDWYF